MQTGGLPFLADWQNFTVIMGTAAATLTGLMFVVVTLMAGLEGHVAILNAAVSAFNTPTIVHFCAVLLVAGILGAPWRAFAGLSVLLGLAGLGGVTYLLLIVRRRMRGVPGYQTPLKDWLWYLALPLAAYITLTGAAVALPAYPAAALYVTGGVMVALLFLGIHNAWDLVTYLAVERAHPEE